MFKRRVRTAQGWNGRIKTVERAAAAVALTFLLSCGLFFVQPLIVHADPADSDAGANAKGKSSKIVTYINPDSGYQVVLEDDADLLTDAEEARLSAQMQEITEYGNAAFKSIDRNSSSAEKFARDYYREKFGQKSGMVFLIDMDNREIYIFSDGAIYRTITKSYAVTITDNVYTYASKGDYYKCGSKAFEQAAALLQGHRIARPMKYICNALLAIISALLINFGLANLLSRAARTGDRELLAHAVNNFSMTQPVVTFLNQTKRYHPTSSGGHSGGGHSGGGHSSGGGGGHKF